jgi:UDP-2,3-diacylglucosamine pyrophosphatase LpxH
MEEILSRLMDMVNHVKTYKTSNTLVIDDLGDFLDGLGGQTTRKGHELPQNMNDKEVFDLALLFKTSLIDSLIEDFDTIICNNVTNDNHAGVFSYFVSSAVKQLLEQRYPGKVFVNSIKRFMHHYSVGNHTFVLCHGKDIGENKFGFKPKLDAIQAEKIDQYCKEHKLYNGNFIEFSKGDSHQAIYDDTTSNDFSYYNYPAFSPPSNWVKTNFKNSKSGFNFFNIKKEENIKISIPFWF